MDVVAGLSIRAHIVCANCCDNISPPTALHALKPRMLCDRVLCFSGSKGSALCFGRLHSANTLAATTCTRVPLHGGYLTDTAHMFHSLNGAGVDIAPFSAMPGEAEVLLLPGLPLVNFPGKNPEPDLWTFEVETPGESVASAEGGSAPLMIDYVHPGALVG